MGCTHDGYVWTDLAEGRESPCGAQRMLRCICRMPSTAACTNNSYGICRCKIAGATETGQGKITVIEALENTSQGNLSDCRAGSQKPAPEIADEKSCTLQGIRHLGKYATQVYIISIVSSFI